MTSPLAILDHLISEQERTLASLLALRAEMTGEAEEPEAEPFRDVDLIDTATASERFALPIEKVRRWCREGCGVKRGGRHLASIPHFRQRLGLE